LLLGQLPADRRGEAHVVAGLRLDLDDVGAEQRQLIGAERPGEIAGEIEDADAGEGFVARRIVHRSPRLVDGTVLEALLAGPGLARRGRSGPGPPDRFRTSFPDQLRP